MLWQTLAADTADDRLHQVGVASLQTKTGLQNQMLKRWTQLLVGHSVGES